MNWLRMPVALALSVAALGYLPAQAQTYPNKPVKIIVANIPGGPSDAVARTIADKLAVLWSQPVVIDNRAGAGGIIGTEAAAKSPPDGYTFNIISTPHITNPALRTKLPYDSVKDFTPLSKLAEGPQILIVHPSLGVKTVADLVKLAKAKPGDIRAGNPGNGTGPHLAAALFEALAGIKLQHIPYTGAGPTTAALVGGEIDIYFDTPGNARPQMEAKKAIALAVTGLKRAPQFPDIPTVAEAGVTGYEYTGWNALAGPARLPDAIVKKVNQDIQTVLAMRDVRARFDRMLFETVGSTPAELGKQIEADIQKWNKIIKDAGIQAQ